MNRFIRYWNQNRKKIIITIAIIAFIIILIRVLNYFAKNNKGQDGNGIVIDPTKPTQSIITGTVVTEEITDNNTETIEKFVKECNEKKYENAFALLSDDCKDVVFNNNINLFIDNYYNNIFSSKKTYNIELYMNTNNVYMYKVTFYEDNLLATGGGNLNKNVEDYITVISQNGENKISINGFVEKKEINKSAKEKDIEIIINSKKIYKNYETYDITIKNYSQRTILLADGQDNKDICLVDTRKIEYEAYIHEIPKDNLTLRNGYKKNINIRFNKLYSVYRDIDKIEFKNIIRDYDAYTTDMNNAEKMAIRVGI